MTTITDSDIELDMSNDKVEELIVKGNNVVIKNLNMRFIKNKAVSLEGNHITLMNCQFSKCDKGTQFIQIKGSHCRLSNCLFENFNENGCVVSINCYKSRPSYCMIDNCNFRDMKESNGEVIRIGDTKSSLYDSKSIIVNNVFSNCDKILLISNSSCANVICYNKIFDCKSGIVLLHGRRCKVLSNYINGNQQEGCCGITVSGKEHTISDNTIEGIGNIDNPFRTSISLICGEVDNKLNGYEPVKNCVITNNDILGCEVAFSLGVHNDKKGEQVLPDKVLIESNRIVKCVKTLDDNEKCLGTKNSFFDNNEELDKDIKIEIPRTSFGGNNIEHHYDFYYKQLMNVKSESSDNEAVDNTVEEEDTEQKEEFEDMLDELDNLLLECSNNDECIRCLDLIKTMNKMKEHHGKEVETLQTDLTFYKDFADKVKKKLNLS